MTDRKENILNVALELFANEGYTATSTSKISKLAGVSEALIFRHFTNKQGLLNAIISEAEIRSIAIFEPILGADNPKTAIQHTIEFPFSIPEKDFDFWKLQFKLKWQKEYNHPEKMKSIIEKLTRAFSDLNYDSPEHEATLLIQILVAVSTDILKGNLQNKKQYKAFLLNKYQI